MDEKLIGRMQLGSAIAVAVAYFLPWSSIISPFGSIQLKGLYIDYAWLILLLAIAHICVQFAQSNIEPLGIPETARPYFVLVSRVAPLAILAFVVWQGAWFQFNLRKGAGGILFGNEMDSPVKAGLDYGFWLAAIGAVVLVMAIGVSTKQIARYAAAAVGIAVIAAGIAFGLTRSGGKLTTLANTTAATAAPSPTVPLSTPVQDFDFSPYVQVVSVKARSLGKDYEASRYSAEIIISPTFQNVSTKTIVGIRGKITVLDGFGHEAFAFKFKDDDKLAAGASSVRGNGYSFEHNQFDNDNPYAKLYPLVSAETAKYVVKITDVAFFDGSVLPPQSKN
jgi:hypothetical protein